MKGVFHLGVSFAFSADWLMVLTGVATMSARPTNFAIVCAINFMFLYRDCMSNILCDFL